MRIEIYSLAQYYIRNVFVATNARTTWDSFQLRLEKCSQLQIWINQKVGA